MAGCEHKIIYLKDYTLPPFGVESVDIRFDLHATATRVTSRLRCQRNSASPEALAPLRLYGESLELCSLRLDGEELSAAQFTLRDGELCVSRLPDGPFELTIETLINPSANTALEGLYLSSGNYCTQCEAEGFRRITFFPDRPDIMALFTTTITADKKSCPVLLSNGNLVERGESADGRHYARWRDPFKKPCYLFALVAGDLVRVADTFTTRSGREVALHIYVERRNREKCEHAMHSLKKAMAWDEEVYGREYDLDIYMIVAVDDFNMGAMENKGLNIFNSKYVLANPQTATDQDYEGIEGVIAHEYFHNWTGNRITCRDWFQLSLKEGLTVFRDQEFSAAVASRPVKRISDARIIRDFQFREDSGPLAHPVRPASYMEINNFYTLTVYNKGAEVIRMIHSLLGAEKFRAGMDLYFARHDGQAVTCDDFVQAMADGGGFDFSQFKRWYSQAGTPQLRVRSHYDEASQRYELTISQTCPPSPGQPEKEPFFIPVAIGLLAGDGADMKILLAGDHPEQAVTTKVLHLREAEQTFVLEQVREKPVLSFLRNFSAPVKVDISYADEELAFLMAHDSDPFNRWNGAQMLGQKYLLEQIGQWQQGRAPRVPPLFIEAFRTLLLDRRQDPAFVALALELPGENWLNQQMAIIDPEGIFTVRQHFRHQLGRLLREELLAVYRDNLTPGPYCYTAAAAGQRALKNICLGYLLSVDPGSTADEASCELGVRQYYEANNMTDVMSALRCVVDASRARGEELLADFYGKWREDSLVVDKWLTLQALCRLPDTLTMVHKLLAHPAFTLKNPNKVRALVGSFCSGNQAQFHAASGEGYKFLATIVAELNALNPQIAARLLTPFTTWRRYDEPRQHLMQAQLERIQALPGLSRDVAEVVGKCLA